MDETYYYGKYIEKQREEKNITKDELGEGLFTLGGIRKVELGETYPEKLTRDRLLARLGESGYDFECFLQPEEYVDWKERRDILDSLDNMELDKAGQLLKISEKKMSTGERVVRQFFLTMKAQWMMLNKNPEAEVGRVLEHAVKLTVPGADVKKLSQQVLSIQELNLLLEYWSCRYPETLKGFCMELLQYLEQNSFDLESRAMLGAKATLYFCDAAQCEKECSAEPVEAFNNLEQVLQVCSAGIDALRNHQKLYYAWELLQKKETCLTEILEFYMFFSEEKVSYYQKELKETKEFFLLIDGLYETYRIPKKTNAFTCFYREREVYCINDVARTRRRMLGITRAELEQELFGKSTLKRLEKNETNMQIGNVRRLFEKLNLSIELHRGQIVTDSQKAIWLEKEYRWEMNQRNFAKAEELLRQLRRLLPMTNRINQQYVEYEEYQLAYFKGELKMEEFIEKAIEALELTLPLSAALAPMKEERTRNGKVWEKEKYLTDKEIVILMNIAVTYKDTRGDVYWDALQEYFEWLEKKSSLATIYGMYGLVMTTVASRLGNQGQYEASNAINEKIVREALRLRTFGYVRRNMHGLLWNEYKQKGLPMSKEDPGWHQGLSDCLMVNVYCKDELLAAKMRKRLET